MRKFTKMMLTLALLFGAVGGVSSVKATPIRLSAKSFSSVGGNASYEDGKLKWKDTGNNVADAIIAEAGVIAQFSSIHFTCSGLTEGATYRVMLTTSDETNYIAEINKTGDVTVNFSELTKQWGSEHPSAEVLATVTKVRFGGGTGGSPSEESPYEITIEPTELYVESESEVLSIATTADWTLFSKMVAAGVSPLDAQLTADVDAGSTMVGVDADDKRYSGTFDGAGHTLTFNYDGGGQFVAPFSCIEGATIKDLLTTGNIKTSYNMPGGIVGKNVGNSTLTRCGSNMTLTSTDSENGRIGGLVGRCADGNQMTFNNCLYNGAISTATSGYACGFVGWDNQAGKITLNNCLVAATSITGGNQNFINDIPVIPDGKYALYISKFGYSTQGTQVTDAQRYNGYVAYTLSSDISEGTLFFGQGYLNSSRVEDQPSLTSDASKKVYKENNNNYFANANGALPDPALYKRLAWKHYGGPQYPYVLVLTAEKAASGFELVSSADCHVLKVTAAGATTLVLPYNVATLPENVKAYNLTVENNVVKATPVSSITADQPVLINAPEGEYKFFSGKDWNHDFSFDEHTSTTNGALTGVYNTSLPFAYVPVNAYVLQNGASGLGFYKVEAENTIKITSFRAYLTADIIARSLEIVFDEDPTGINKVTAKKAEENGAYFNLAGQRVAQPKKGLYIVNGKKVVIK